MLLLRRARGFLVLWIMVLGLPLSACGDPIVFGRIPPSTFQFTSVVPADRERSSGWKVAQVIILLGRLSPRYPEAAFCQIEIGVPELSGGLHISTVAAQKAAATAADEAARLVLEQRLPTAVACEEFRKTMRTLMSERGAAYIPGVRVSAFNTGGIPQQTFP